jgi:2-hydroxycyclohexanecarboxyl-CoA dehydrogenase
MDLGLKDKVALVTGAGAGMCRIIAHTFAQEGANVIVNDLPPGDRAEKEWVISHRMGGKPFADTPEKLIGEEATARIGKRSRAEATADECRQFGVKAMVAYASVLEFDQVEAMVKKGIDEFGQIDILVNGVGGTIPGGDFATTNPEDWRYPINLNLYGVLNCVRAALPHMIEKGYGKVVNILSEAWKGADRTFSVYGATKAGVSSFTRTLAAENGRYGINFNCVSPGGTSGVEWTEQEQKAVAAELGEEEAARRQKAMLRAYPLGRFYGALGTPQDVADMTVFLCSDRAKWVTGQTISVSGGYHMH